MEKNYATDFLMDRGLEIIDRAVDKNKPFAVMVSIPDPHSPNIVRPPYDTMHDHLEFKVPFTAKTAFKKEPALPGWQALKLDISRAAQTVEEMEMDRQRHKYYSYIYGMIKLIDDNVGKLLNHLEAKGLTDNTIGEIHIFVALFSLHTIIKLISIKYIRTTHTSSLLQFNPQLYSLQITEINWVSTPNIIKVGRMRHLPEYQCSFGGQTEFQRGKL